MAVNIFLINSIYNNELFAVVVQVLILFVPGNYDVAASTHDNDWPFLPQSEPTHLDM
jgi:hypothetical protein